MTRAQALEYLRLAGYHDDKAEFTRLYVENRIAYPKALEAFRAGARQRAAGVPCSCRTCKEAACPSA